MRIHDSGEAKKDRRMAPAPPAPADAGLTEKIAASIREVYDPEIPVNLYDLGLIYEIRPSAASRSCVIRMTLTSANCPEAQSLPVQVQQAAEAVDGIDDAHVVLVWEPAWDKSMMSDEAQLHLGLL